MLPEYPEIPNFPQVAWFYQNGNYCLSESDADKILNYKENTLPHFEWEVRQYKKQAEIIYNSLLQKTKKE